MPIEIGAVVASVNEGRVRLGICTALQGCYARVLGLAAVESNALRSAHAASLDWLDTNKLLENTHIRALMSSGRTYAVSSARAIVIDHIVPPLVLLVQLHVAKCLARALIARHAAPLCMV